MAVAKKSPKTPSIVIRHGWRDDAYKKVSINGPKVCVACGGWGCRIELVGDGSDRHGEHETCRTCRGTGHELVT